MSSAVAQRLAGKTILIMGASSGIGRSTAFEFARASPSSLKLILAARRLENLKQIAKDISGAVGTGVEIWPCQLDVGRPAEVKKFVPNLPTRFRNIDILVNNAGLVRGVAEAPDIAHEDLDEMLRVNVQGLINMTQAVLEIYKQRSDGGRGDVVMIGSIAGREPYKGGSVYCASKAAVRSFSEALRKELTNTRIRVVVIDPGQVQTEFSTVRFYGDQAKADAVYANCEPLTPEDIAESIVFAVGRRENVIIADMLIYPSHQGGATALYKAPAAH